LPDDIRGSGQVRRSSFHLCIASGGHAEECNVTYDRDLRWQFSYCTVHFWESKGTRRTRELQRYYVAANNAHKVQERTSSKRGGQKEVWTKSGTVCGAGANIQTALVSDRQAEQTSANTVYLCSSTSPRKSPSIASSALFHSRGRLYVTLLTLCCC
jgi:hypothetical protein